MASERSFRDSFDNDDSDTTISDSLSLNMDTFNENENQSKKDEAATELQDEILGSMLDGHCVKRLKDFENKKVKVIL